MKLPYYSSSLEESTLPYLYMTLFFIIVHAAFNQYLNYRQYKSYFVQDPPQTILDACKEIDPEGRLIEKIRADYTKSTLYGRDKMEFAFYYSLFQTLFEIFFFIFGYLPYSWDYSKYITNKFGYDNIYVNSVLFVQFYLLTSTLFEVPFTLYNTFVIEERYEMNRTSIRLFILDIIKTFIISCIFITIIIPLLIYTVIWSGDSFYYYLTFVIFIISISLMYIYPNIILPLFNTLTRLQNDDIRNKIYEICNKVNFPLSDISVIDGSLRSGHSNAYFVGFFKYRRVVIYDTLIKQLNENEICAILGHELGHWKLNHLEYNMIINVFINFSLFSTFSFFMKHKDFYRSFGFEETPFIVGLILFVTCLWNPISFVLNILLSMLSRSMERTADSFASELCDTKDLQLGLIKLHIDNLSCLNPDLWYSFFHYTHPTLIERIKSIQKNKIE